MEKKVFIWLAHPAKESFCGALADAYQQGAENAGAKVRRTNLNGMEFTSEFEGYKDTVPLLETDLLRWQQNLDWADHFVVVHPYWWGAMPARAKMVFDRALTSGFAFKYHDRKLAWDKLLKGKTGDAIITADTPTWVDTFLYFSPGRRVIKNQVFKFCGIQPKTIAHFGSVKVSTEEQRKDWLTQAESMGRKAASC